MKSSVLKAVHISEKSYQKASEHRYSFISPSNVSKAEARVIVEESFGVKVDKINSAVLRGKIKRTKAGSGLRSNRKKFTVSVKDGKSIDLYEIEKEEKPKKT
ncbi:50S ribosomal protein L23 [Candidatus Berkelbacteria bacterium RIFOXYA2_FULL_43_10]|uniref:Large ribosomal subunit protein uL23 n=1 Tax=Candidatus Berkelbacteria bacterium RIFOXYA2_FULL_43_10 TaxID=1797472 RepID=A0A1F5EA12_9BACT|nr:MAG: 50S ribosomal protein L23 [Candidatus Berkelbacteria bacterium RIFOXYA2_FULL_43_10]